MSSYSYFVPTDLTHYNIDQAYMDGRKNPYQKTSLRDRLLPVYI